jgi:hypothetical protein
MYESADFSAYGDESGTFTERFQAIAMISGPEKALSILRNRLRGILADTQVNEVKFALLRTHLPIIRAAHRFIRCTVEDFASRKAARVDVLVWDTRDSRHAIQGRDDVANLERMYYKLFAHLARQWNRSEWSLYPDQNSQIHWNELLEILNKTGLTRQRSGMQLGLEIEQLQTFIQIGTIEPCDSVKEPLIQLADLFAGMARFTKEESDNCVQWLDSWGQKGQPQLPNFICDIVQDEATQTKQNRFQFIGEFKSICDKFRMGVSLRDKGYLCTFHPAYPINFWNYEPQYEYDRAPRRTNGA